jgi:SAM-dependent methyltransferase
MFALLPDNFDQAKIYDDSYFTGASGYGIPDYDHLWKSCLGRFYVPRLGRIREFQNCGRLLDIGCAAGYFLKAAREQGWEIAGVELSPRMRERAAAQLGCTVYASIDDALRSGEKFDCVSMFEVIEHVTDPVSALREVVDLVKPGGLLALSTPNCESPNALTGAPINIWFRPPMHLCYFAPPTITAMLERSGMKVVTIEGLRNYSALMSGEMALPEWVKTVLGPFRRGKTLRPRGAIGKLLKRMYQNRLSLYQCRGSEQIKAADVMEIYARKLPA